jgi:cytochrome o ubiquinol oxidase subunit 2
MLNNKKTITIRLIQVLISSFVAIAIVGLLAYVMQGRDIPVLDTHGTIANQQRDLILIVFGLGMLIVIPVLTMLFVIAWKYRAGNTKAKYQPNFNGHAGLEALWWGVPCVVIIILAIITAISTYALDPYKPLESNVTPVKVQVVALEWKWLFIYPDQGVAAVNTLYIPEDTPIDLTITSDAPMNSFWVPALAGQVYAMSGMSTQLHIMADEPGTYNGSSANISGDGFADMTFKVISLPVSGFTEWQRTAAVSPTQLTSTSYASLSQPSKQIKETTYSLMNKDLYTEIIMKYMPSDNTSGQHTEKDSTHHSMPGMDM